MMHKNSITVAFIREHKRYSLRGQKQLASSHGITKIYDDLELCIRQRRAGAGDIIAVKRLVLLADPASLRKSGGIRKSLYDAIDAIDAADASILELDTGRTSSDPKQREMMVREAVDSLSRARSGRKIGRPARTWTDEQKTIIQMHWFDSRHLTNDDAIDAMNAVGLKVSAGHAYRLFGPSGRKPGSPLLRVETERRSKVNRVTYFIQSGGDDGAIKIGTSLDVTKRMRALQTSHHERLTLLGVVKSHEWEIHAKFDEYRLGGEWFRCAGKLAAFVKKLKRS